MDPISNPFRPGAGSRPPALVGRDRIIGEAEVNLRRTLTGHPERGLMLRGFRGVGKTVLLREIERRATPLGVRSIFIETVENHELVPRLALGLRSVLYELDRVAGFDAAVRRTIGVVRSFASAVRVGVGAFEIGIDLPPERGVADSGRLELDLPEVLVQVGKAAALKHTAVLLLIDEVQYLSPDELAAIAVAMHRIQQEDVPVGLMGAGLPSLPRLAGQAKTYAERLFSYPMIGSLEASEAKRAIVEPLHAAGADITDEAVNEISRVTEGYPYFLQEWGSHSWNLAASTCITLADVARASVSAKTSLDTNFFRVRVDRLAPFERRFLRAMADQEHGAVRISEVASRLNRGVSGLGPVRASLISQGMIYSVEHGKLAFTVPLFGDFMRREYPTLDAA